MRLSALMVPVALAAAACSSSSGAGGGADAAVSGSGSGGGSGGSGSGSSGSNASSGSSSGGGSGSSSGSGGSDAGPRDASPDAAGGAVHDSGANQCWQMWPGPQGAGTCTTPWVVCVGGAGFDAIVCPDGHTYSASCSTGATQCSCSCKVDGASPGVSCIQPQYDRCDGGAAPPENASCSSAIASPAACNFPAIVSTGTSYKTCCSDADCPPFLPACTPFGCTKKSVDQGGYVCPPPPDAGADSGPPPQSCKSNADCPKDQVCSGTTCARQSCKDASTCPSGYTCPSGVCVH